MPPRKKRRVGDSSSTSNGRIEGKHSAKIDLEENPKTVTENGDTKITRKSRTLQNGDVKKTRKTKTVEENDDVKVKGKSKTVKQNGDTKSKGKSKTVKENGDTPSYTHWLMKSEPESRIEKGVDFKFGIEDLKKEPNQTACWDGVRNYQARNFMRDQMREGQQAFFYHSNCKEPGIAGIIEIVKESYPDHTQFEKKNHHYDSKATPDGPRWFMVDVKYIRMMKRFIPLSELKDVHAKHKASGGPLKNVALFTRARLSVQPITPDEWDFILTLEEQ